MTRLAGRLVTGPAAFLLAGVLDLLIYAAGAARTRLGSGRRRARVVANRRRG